MVSEGRTALKAWQLYGAGWGLDKSKQGLVNSERDAKTDLPALWNSGSEPKTESIQRETNEVQ